MLGEAGCNGDGAGQKMDTESVGAGLKDKYVHATVLRFVKESGLATSGSRELIEVHPGPLQRALKRCSLRSVGELRGRWDMWGQVKKQALERGMAVSVANIWQTLHSCTETQEMSRTHVLLLVMPLDVLFESLQPRCHLFETLGGFSLGLVYGRVQ